MNAGAPGRRWPASAVAAACAAAVVLAGLLGWLGGLGARLDFASGPLAAALAFTALGPLAFYGFVLERGGAAPALRSSAAPWVLLADLYGCVCISGGMGSPLWGAYPLLAFVLARNAGGLQAAAVAACVTALEAFPLWARLHGGDPSGPAAASWWPQAMALALPGLALGLGLAGRARGGGPASPPPQAGSAPGAPPAAAASPVPSFSCAPPIAPPAAVRGPAASADPPQGKVAPLDRELGGCLDLAFLSHPGWNALTLWWGGPEGVDLRHARLRQGSAVDRARVVPGEGLLGLALRERKALAVAPLSAGAAAQLPYARAPYAAQALRVVPLEDEGRLVGLLACDKPLPEPFGVDEDAVLAGLARLLVAQFQRDAQFGRLTAAGGRTQKLYAAAQTLSTDLERAELLARFGGLLRGLVACDSWTLAMREGDSAPLERLAGEGYASDGPRVLSLDRAGALAATLSQADGALLFNGGPGGQIPAAFLEGLSSRPRHFLLAPLRQGGRLIGVLKLDREAPAFDEDDRDAAYIFASQAAATLEHARLYALHRRLATTDGLTGLYNHRYFQERLAQELGRASRSGRPLALALTDIDFFKKFNDNFGHQEGDAVLRRVARLLEGGLRPGRDVAARYGGEEFAVIMPDCDVVEARQLMEALRADCAARLSGGDAQRTQAITLSIGVSVFPAAAREQADLIRSADEALYRAKHAGRDRVCTHKDA